MKLNKSLGQASKLLLVLAIVVLVAVIITFLILKMTEKPPAPVVPKAPVVELPVYDKSLGNIEFVYISAIDKGDTLYAADAVNGQYGSLKDFVIDNPGAKFIQVTIGAKNIGTMDTVQNAWNIENIVDSKGRNFIPVQQYSVGSWLPTHSLCASILKPAFDPTPCTKIYEVSKESTGLKIRVETGKNNSTVQSSASGKNDTFLLDLIVK